MLEIDEFEEVKCIRMSREVDGKPVYWVASYLVDGLLIDTGCRHTADELVDYLDGENARLVVNTHFHEDHVGANSLIQERFGVEIYAHADSVPLINQVPELHPYQEFVWGYPEPSRVSELGDSIETPGFHFEVLETEGHSTGHVVLLEPAKGWCFSGDIYITERPKVVRADEDVAGLVRTMRRMAQLDTERLVLFTSMGEIVPQGRQALLSCVEYLEDLSHRAGELAAEGLSVDAIIVELLGRGSVLAEVTGGHFSSYNLIRGVLSMSS
jgi:glyoxylase-like metal-dependent hydrolase (beta-lactamase superfamily II)